MFWDSEYKELIENVKKTSWGELGQAQPHLGCMDHIGLLVKVENKFIVTF